MKLTRRGYAVVLVAFLALLGIAGYVETQPNPTCANYQTSQDCERDN